MRTELFGAPLKNRGKKGGEQITLSQNKQNTEQIGTLEISSDARNEQRRLKGFSTRNDQIAFA